LRQCVFPKAEQIEPYYRNGDYLATFPRKVSLYFPQEVLMKTFGQPLDFIGMLTDFMTVFFCSCLGWPDLNVQKLMKTPFLKSIPRLTLLSGEKDILFN